MAKITWKITQKINLKSDDELVKTKREEINNTLSENKAGIKLGKTIVFFIDECQSSTSWRYQWLRLGSI